MLILGPLSECVAEKMIKNDFPQQFERCLMTRMNCSQDAMEKGLQNNIFVDYRKRDSIYECTTVQAIRDICDKVRDIFVLVFFFMKWKIETQILSIESTLYH